MLIKMAFKLTNAFFFTELDRSRLDRSYWFWMQPLTMEC